MESNAPQSMSDGILQVRSGEVRTLFRGEANLKVIDIATNIQIYKNSILSCPSNAMSYYVRYLSTDC